MSKAVRIREHLYAEIEALAKAERRSMIAQLEVLLEQALRMQERTEADALPRDGGEEQVLGSGGVHTEANRSIRALPAVTDDHFKPFFKKGKS